MAHNVGQLSSKYTKIQDISTIIIFLLLTLMFRTMHRFEATEIKQVEVAPDIEIEVVDITTQVKQQQAPESRATIPVAMTEDEEINLVDDVVFEMASADFDFDDVPPPPPPPSVASTEVEIIEFFAVEERPEVIGGMQALYDNITVPRLAIRSGISGRVTLQFVAGVDGKATDIRILTENPEGYDFAEEAIKALQKVAFKPGKQRDKPVPVRMSLPITFNVKR